MDRMKQVVGAAAVAGPLLLIVLLVMPSTGPTTGAFSDLQATPADDGAAPTALRLSSLQGDAPRAVYGYTPEMHVIVVKVSAEDLAAAQEATGQPVAKWAVEHPHEPGMRILAYDAKSTHLGCSVDLLERDDVRAPDGVPAVWLIDQCHHGLWNVLAMARPMPGTPAPRPLSVVPLALGPGSDPAIQVGHPFEQDHAFDAADARLSPRSG